MADHPLKGYVRKADPKRQAEVGARNILTNLERCAKAKPGEKNSEYEEAMRRMLSIYLEQAA